MFDIYPLDPAASMLLPETWNSSREAEGLNGM